MQLKQSTARNVALKVFLTSDHVSPATGKTLTVTLSKDGAAFAAAAGAVTELSNGWYKLALTTADTNTLGDLAIRATAADSDAAERLAEVVAFDPQSATSLGLSNLDATVSSRLATSGYTAPSTPPTVGAIRAEMDASSTKLANLDATVSSRLATAGYTVPPTAVENADALLKHDWTAVTGEAARSVLNALRALRNKVSRSGSTLTITKEDDTTTAWTAALTTDAAAEPVVGSDPS